MVLHLMAGNPQDAPPACRQIALRLFCFRLVQSSHAFHQKLLKLSWIHSAQILAFLTFSSQRYKWIDKFPFVVLIFPISFSFVPPPKDLPNYLQKSFSAANTNAIEPGVACQIIHIPPQDFLDVVVSGKCCQLQGQRSVGLMVSFRINGKSAPPTWFAQTSDCKLLPVQLDNRSKLHGITKRFIAAQSRYECFKKVYPWAYGVCTF